MELYAVNSIPLKVVFNKNEVCNEGVFQRKRDEKQTHIVHLTKNSLFCDIYFTQRQVISFFFSSVVQRDLLSFVNLTEDSKFRPR